MVDLKNIFRWDEFSDQPHVIRDRAARQIINKMTRFAQLKLLLINLIMLPLVLLRFVFALFESKKVSTTHFFGMSINLDKEPELSKSLIEELGVKTLLIRLPLSDMKNFDAYVAFIKAFQEYDLLINILQDREHVEDLNLLKDDLNTIFKTSKPYTCKFQIGNAINRKKWAFFSMDEYLAFYEVAQKLKTERYPELTLIGSSIIDFEYHYTVRTLFNFYRVHYDIFSSLLYVDRRGAPENTQMGLDLTKKIKLLYAIMTLSDKTQNRLIITETNWPRSNTAPYAPTSEKECVNEADYDAYMVRYYLLALGTGMVESVYWHQLIAPGYGLIDNREGIKKYRAFEAFKTMLSFIDDSEVISFELNSDIYQFTCKKGGTTIKALWSQKKQTQTFHNAAVYSMYHNQIDATDVVIGNDVIYVVEDY